MYQSLRHRCRSLRLNRMPSCFPTALMFGVRGIGPAPDTAFEQAALACTSARHRSHAHCPKESHRGDLRGAGRDLPAARLAQCSDHEMAVRRLVFGRFAVSIEGNRLYGRAWESRSTERATCPRSSPRNGAFRPARQQPRANDVAKPSSPAAAQSACASRSSSQLNDRGATRVLPLTQVNGSAGPGLDSIALASHGSDMSNLRPRRPNTVRRTAGHA
jgi:hypothetical protein